MRKFISNKNLINLSYKTQVLHKIYNQNISKKVLTSFQTKFYNRQELRNYYKITANYLENKQINTILKMEKRIDVVLVRMNLVLNIDESRQKLISGNILINNNIIKSYNYKLRAGDIIEIKELNTQFKDIVGYVLSIPSNMDVNYKIKIGIYNRDANLKEIGIPVTLC